MKTYLVIDFRCIKSKDGNHIYSTETLEIDVYGRSGKDRFCLPFLLGNRFSASPVTDQIIRQRLAGGKIQLQRNNPSLRPLCPSSSFAGMSTNPGLFCRFLIKDFTVALIDLLDVGWGRDGKETVDRINMASITKGIAELEKLGRFKQHPLAFRL